MNRNMTTKKTKEKSAWCMTDEEKADYRSRDMKALERAKEMERHLQDRLVTRRADGTTIITASPAMLDRLLAAIH